MRRLLRDKPLVLTGSPMCGPFGIMNNMIAAGWMQRRSINVLSTEGGTESFVYNYTKYRWTVVVTSYANIQKLHHHGRKVASNDCWENVA